MDQVRKPKAFISCSLRGDDKHFVEWVEKNVRAYGMDPFGTVGKFEISPKLIPESMREQINLADCIVIAATPRFVQEDIQNRTITGKGISDLLHVELGMAFMKRLPVLAFVLADTDVGSFLPGTTQYIRIYPNDDADFAIKRPQIASLFLNSLKIIQERWKEQKDKEMRDLGSLILKVAGVVGIATILFDDDDPKGRSKKR